ncbi:MAG: 3',5'-cyclic-AMP phosphodiesterase [Methylococcaceae bacterium]|jgi:Icc protein
MVESARPFQILQISDLHIRPNTADTLLGIDTDYYFAAVLEHAFTHEKAIDLILLTGDLAQDPSPASYQRIFHRLTDYAIPSVCLPGNHDDYKLMQAILGSQFISCRKQLLINNWQLICLNSQLPDSPCGQLPEDEIQFLLHCLKSHPTHHAIIALHHHSIPTQSKWMDEMIISNHQQFWELIGQYPNIKAVTCGHIHQTLQEIHNGVQVWGTPSTCFQFTPLSPEFSLDDKAPGYRVIQLNVDGSCNTRINRLPHKLVGLDPTGRY